MSPLPGLLAGAPRVSGWIRFPRGGRLRVLSGRVELGQGALTALLQIAATELGIELARVDMTGADTRVTPDEGVIMGSLSVSQGGMAIRYAAAAARGLNCAAEDLSIAVGVLRRDGAPAGGTSGRSRRRWTSTVPSPGWLTRSRPGRRRGPGTRCRGSTCRCG